MQTWQLPKIPMPDGTRSPVVLYSDDEARAVLIGLDPGQELGDHQVHENAFVLVVEGGVRVGSGGDTVEAEPGTLFKFDPDERHSISS